MRNLIYLVIAIVFVATYWYLVEKPAEFEVNLNVQTLPGDVIQTLKIWDRSNENSEIVEVGSFDLVVQQVRAGNASYLFRWNFDQDKSKTDINVQVSEPGNELKNKLLIPFTNSEIEVVAEQFVREFYEVLHHHLEITKVSEVSEVHMPEKQCVCISLETGQLDKANGMMRSYNLLSGFVEEHHLELDGKPIVQLTKWDHSLGQISYDFCFPIRGTDHLNAENSIEIKTLNAGSALMLTYHGNYITSDRAWYYLLDFAAANDYQVSGLPREVFYNNPNMGVNETSWRAEIFLPVEPKK